MNISHVGFMNLHEVMQILDWTTSTKAANFNITLDDTIRDDVDVIVFGTGDGGSDLTDKLDALITANDNGVGILFMHDFPKIDEYDVRYENFGVAGKNESYEYNMYNRTNILIPGHDIININYDIGTMSLDIQETHNIGTELSADCAIILNNPNLPEDSYNYYLACLERVDKGKIVHSSLGHNSYKSDMLLQLSEEECNMFANAIIWIAGL